eukprot:1110333-Pleurochrysis_carterae.AAC.1
MQAPTLACTPFPPHVSDGMLSAHIHCAQASLSSRQVVVFRTHLRTPSLPSALRSTVETTSTNTAEATTASTSAKTARVCAFDAGFGPRTGSRLRMVLTGSTAR